MTPARLKSYADELLGSVFLEALIHGNTTLEVLSIATLAAIFLLFYPQYRVGKKMGHQLLVVLLSHGFALNWEACAYFGYVFDRRTIFQLIPFCTLVTHGLEMCQEIFCLFSLIFG